MDVLRKELSEIYESQALDSECLEIKEIERCCKLAEAMVSFSNGCVVITDASRDCSYMYTGSLGVMLGITNSYPCIKEVESSDEDVIYFRINPQDLVDKRMLEYEFFKFVDVLSGVEKLSYQATCRIRIKNRFGNYSIIDNTTQVIGPSPSGKIWLIMCTYTLSPDQKWQGDISPVIKDNLSGKLVQYSFTDKRKDILSDREKEILLLIKSGLASKQIAHRLCISINTVNRHRQNIIEKLSVANSIEAITAAESMRLL